MDSNYLKFYVGKRLLQKVFRQDGLPYLSGTVLDIGSGSAPYHGELTHCRLVSLERDPQFRPRVVGSALALPFGAHVFNGVICTEVLEHLPEPEACWSEIRRVLKPGGSVYITAPMTWYLHYEPHDYYRFTPHGLRYLAVKYGFSVVSLRPVGGLAAVLVMLVTERIYNTLFKFLFFVPKSYRPYCLAPLIIPISVGLYYSSRLFDAMNTRWAFSVVLVGKKDAESGKVAARI